MRKLFLTLFSLLVAVAASGCSNLPLSGRGGEIRDRQASASEGALDALRPIYPSGSVTLDSVDGGSSWQRNRFSFQVYCDQAGDFRVVRGEYYRSLRGQGTSGCPLIAISPILGGEGDGYLAARFIARESCRWGFSAFFLYQERSILSPSRDALGLEARMRRSVRDNISALEAFSALDEIDSRRLGSFGVSLGAIRNIVLMAAEPRLRANVVCLGGLDLAAIVRTSKEKMVLRYLSTRMEKEAVSAREVENEFRQFFSSNPLKLAREISPEGVLLFLAAYDDVVPYRQGLDLRQMLGGPEAHLLPLGHYTALLAAPWITSTSLGWVQSRFSEVRRLRGLKDK